MFKLRNYLTSDGELTAQGRRLLIGGSWLYFLMLCILCFIPQVPEPGMETPGIQYFGRVVVLLIPFNSFLPFVKSIKALSKKRDKTVAILRLLSYF